MEGYSGHPLDGPRTKVDRAVEHLNALGKEWEAFLKTDPYQLVIEFDSDACCHAAVLRVNSFPPLKVGAIVGDLAHNLRSALDHVAWRLARLDHSAEELMKPRVRNRIYFPITTSPENLRSHSIAPYVRDAAKTVIEALQPYHGANGLERHPLSRINRLANADKHRILHTAFGALDMTGVRFTPAAIDIDRLLEGVTVDLLVGHGDSVEDGTKVAHIRFPGPPDTQTTKVHVSRQPRTQVLIADAPHVLSEIDLGDLCAHAGYVIAQVEPFFT